MKKKKQTFVKIILSYDRVKYKRNYNIDLNLH